VLVSFEPDAKVTLFTLARLLREWEAALRAKLTKLILFWLRDTQGRTRGPKNRDNPCGRGHNRLLTLPPRKSGA